MNITTHLLIALLSIPTAGGGALEDLCDIVNPDTGVPVRCEVHEEGAPLYDEAVCCSSSTCYEAKDGGCPDALQPYYCELGERLASDEIACYFEVANYCDLFPCAPGYQTQPQSYPMCCNAGICWHLWDDEDCELEDVYWCGDGVTNMDGTVTCLD